MSSLTEEIMDGFVVLDKSRYFDALDARIIETPHPGDIVTYAVQVSRGENSRWLVEKRYSEFRALTNTLQSSFKAQRRHIPRLPKTHVFRATNRDAGLLEERRLGLNQFLHDLLRSDLADTSPVHSFLEVPQVCVHPTLHSVALKRMRAGFRWTCLAHTLHFRKAQPSDKLNGSLLDPCHTEPDTSPTQQGGVSSQQPPLDADDLGFKVPNTSLSSHSWLCSGVNLRCGIQKDGLGDTGPGDLPDDDQESTVWHELSDFHWRGLSQFNLNSSLRCGTTRFKAHFKKDCGRVRVAMNPIALYMDALPCPHAFLGSGVLYSSDDVQISRGLVFYDPKHGAGIPDEDRNNFLLHATFRRDTEEDYKLFVQVANHLRCKTQDARTLFKLMQAYDVQRAKDLFAAAADEAATMEGRDFEIGSWVDLELQRAFFQEDGCQKEHTAHSHDGVPNGHLSGRTSTTGHPSMPPMPSSPRTDVLPVHLRVVDRDLSILLSFTVFTMLLRRCNGACEIVFLGANEFVALRCGKFSFHTWDAFREREEREPTHHDEDSPRSLFTEDNTEHRQLPTFAF